MSNPATIYRLNWQAFHESTDLQCYIDISDMDNLVGGDSEIIPLEGSGEPARLSVIDNNEDPFTVIRAQQLTIKFNSTNTVNAATFMSGTDSRWFVHYYLGDDTNTIFKGFLVMDDISELFLPAPNVVTLTANDGLGLLKDIKLVNADGDNPQGYHRISDYLTWALRKTGMELSLWAAFNIKRSDLISDISVQNNDAEHFFYTTFLEAKTFEDEIGTSINCYEVIEQILGEEACLFQMWGKWWIMRIDEVEDANRGLYISTYDSSGSFVENSGEIHWDKTIGKAYDIWFADAGTNIFCSRPHKRVRLNFEYETAKEVPCNIDFSRGTIFSDTPTLKKYSIECWTKLYKDGTGDHASGANMYIEVQFIDGYEVNRYLHFEDNGVFNFILSEGIPVNQSDKANISVNRRMESDHGTAGVDNCVQLRLYGDDGSFWTHHGKNGQAAVDSDIAYWVSCDSLFQTNQKFHGFEVADDYDDTESTSLYSGEVGPVPVAGTIKMLIYVSDLWGGTEDTYIEDASFEYLPYINGSYQKYTGQYHETTQTPAVGEFKAVREKRVYISDSPKKLFKGGLFKFDGSNYVLVSENWYNAAVFPSGPPSSDYIHPYGEIQLFDVWNQFKNEMRIVQGVMQGIDLDETKLTFPYPAHLINKWQVGDMSSHVTNKKFILLSFDQDHNNQSWTGVLRETVDTDVAKDYLNHVFKYIT